VIESRTPVDGRLSCRRDCTLQRPCQCIDLVSDGLSVDRARLPRQECRTRGGQLGHAFHGAVGLRGTTTDEIDRALVDVTNELGWTADDGGEVELAVLSAGESVWLTAATSELGSLARGLARTLRRPVRWYRVEVDGGALSCQGHVVRPDGGSTPIDGTSDRDGIDSSASPADLAEERLRVLLDANEDIDADRARTSRRFAVRRG